MRQLLLEERVRVRSCDECGARFSYPVGRGTDRKHCSSRCRVAKQLRLRAIRVQGLPACSNEGCDNPATRRKAGLCEKCYTRVRRTGSPKKRGPKPRNPLGNNREYVREYSPEHPLSDSTGMVLQHRRVAHDRHGDECPACHWCGRELTWKTAVIDHIDEDKRNNAATNLAVSCNLCNLQRTPAMAFMSRITTDALIDVMHSMKTARENARRHINS